jgi:hypothetical protein
VKRLSPKWQRWLKAFHSFFACMWVGAAIVLGAKQFFVNPVNGGELFGIHDTMKFIDDFIIIPGAMGVRLTAIIYSVWTIWGWFTHRWITAKWLICLYGVAFGTFPLGPWQNSLVRIARDEGISDLGNPTYLHNTRMLYVFGPFQVYTLAFAVFVTALRPWQRKPKR